MGTEKLIVVYVSRASAEDIAEGMGFGALEERIFDLREIADKLGEWGPTTDVTAAVRFLLGETGQFWAADYSHSEFYPEGFYSYTKEDPYTGDLFEYTAHLEGFDRSELIEIYERVTRKLPGY